MSCLTPLLSNKKFPKVEIRRKYGEKEREQLIFSNGTESQVRKIMTYNSNGGELAPTEKSQVRLTDARQQPQSPNTNNSFI